MTTRLTRSSEGTRHTRTSSRHATERGAKRETAHQSSSKKTQPGVASESFEPSRPSASSTRTAAATTGPVYDGSRPAPGTTNPDAWVPAQPPVHGDPSARNRATYDNVINQFAVGSNQRYTPRGGNTYCNIFAWDVMSAMGVQLPHWVSGNGQPSHQGAPGAYELNANGVYDWLNQNGSQHGWRQVSAEEAQRLANQGHPAVVTYHSRSSAPGHIAVVRPGEMTSQGPTIAQAGAENTNLTHVRDTFGNAPVQYWVNDGGRVTDSPSTPTPTPPKPGPSTGAPQADLQFDGGSTYSADVEQLQRALVKTGFLTQAEMDTGPGYYGNRTKAAVARLQEKYGITGDGGEHYGPRTRAALTQALGTQGTPPTPPKPTPPSGPSVRVPQGDLQYDGGSAYNAEVEQLQRALVKGGFLSQAEMDTGPGFYGNRTKAAVARLQEKYGITDDGGVHYGPRTRAALTQALGTQGSPSTPTGPSTPTSPGGVEVVNGITLSKKDAETARRVDQMLANDYPSSRMQGMGAVLVDACRKERVPLDLVLAQLGKESTFLRPDNTLSIANNNPGNLRFASWESQYGGTHGQGNFTHFPSVEKGLRAYVHLLGSPDLPYREMVDRRDWAALVHLYAPASDGNNEAEYTQQLHDWTAYFARKVGITSNWVNER